MNTAETDQKLKEAFSHAVPDVLNLVLSDCQKQKGSDMKMKDSGKNRCVSGSWPELPPHLYCLSEVRQASSFTRLITKLPLQSLWM